MNVDGVSVGDFVIGPAVGSREGSSLGLSVGFKEGESVGALLGETVGSEVGDGVTWQTLDESSHCHSLFVPKKHDSS